MNRKKLKLILENTRINQNEKMLMIAIALGIPDLQSMFDCFPAMDRGIIVRTMELLLSCGYVEMIDIVKKNRVNKIYVLSNKIFEAPKIPEKKIVSVIQD
jgi:hypothetical protein